MRSSAASTTARAVVRPARTSEAMADASASRITPAPKHTARRDGQWDQQLQDTQQTVAIIGAVVVQIANTNE